MKWVRLWSMIWLAPCHNLYKCCLVANGNIRNKPLRHLNQDTDIVSVAHLLEKVVCKMLVILFSPQYVNSWGRVTHICVSKQTTTISGNGLSPDRRRAIVWTNAGMLLMAPFGTNFSEILIEIGPFLFLKMHLKMSSVQCRPFFLGLNMFIQ